ncbi:hypothetical protein H0H93_008865 [Arthromyces matolae]|nr:hypothetical protein H0H93_008865 [Arthromyces matolae]
MAAVLRASGIVASFVYNSWLQKSNPPSPADILKAIRNAAFTPMSKRILILRIPPEVSGSYNFRDTIGTAAPPSPPKMPDEPVTSPHGSHSALVSTSQLPAGYMNAHDRDASTAGSTPPPPNWQGFIDPHIGDLISPPDHAGLWPFPG